MRKRVLFCGSREWGDLQSVMLIMCGVFAMSKSTGMIVLHGGARGADTEADRAAAQLGIVRHVFPAQWDLHGKSAGPIRNEEMLKSGVDLVVAFKDDFNGIGGRGGTEHMCTIAKRADVSVWHVYHDDAAEEGLTVVNL